MWQKWGLPTLASLACFLFFTACETPRETGKKDWPALTLTSDKPVVWEQSGESFTLQVIGDDLVDYTSSATYYVNGEPIEGNIFIPSAGGSYNVWAKHGGATSNTLVLHTIYDGFQFPSLKVVPDAASVTVGEGYPFSFKVFGIVAEGLEMDISALSSICVNGNPVPGLTFTPTAVGEYAVHAVYKAKTSPAVTVRMTADAPQSFSHNVLVEEFTGTWCPYCPRASWAVELLHKQTGRVHVAAIHCSSKQGTDPWNFTEIAILKTALRFYDDFPTCYLNRQGKWKSPEYDNVSQPVDLLQENSPYGISIASQVGGTVDVTFVFRQAVPSARYVVYLLEDGLKYHQYNYYLTNNSSGLPSLYGGAYLLSDFTHNDVVRKALTSAVGDNIPAGQSDAGVTYKASLPLPSYEGNAENSKVMVILLDATVGKALNVQVAPMNGIKRFEAA